MLNYCVVYMKGALILKKFGNLVIILSLTIACVLLFSCKKNNSEVLDELVREKMEKNDAYSSFTATSVENDPLLIALENGETFFEGAYTSDNEIWHFMPDGTVNAYDAENNVSSYTYALTYSGGSVENKYIEFYFPDKTKKYRFKKLTANGFDVLYIDEAGDDVSVFTFIKSSFFEALFNSRPFFEETLYQGNSVWNFKEGGILKTYGTNGEVYDYTYNLEYSLDDEGETVRQLIIAENFGTENEYIVTLKIKSFAAGKFNAVKIENGKESGNAITFAKQ